MPGLAPDARENLPAAGFLSDCEGNYTRGSQTYSSHHEGEHSPCNAGSCEWFPGRATVLRPTGVAQGQVDGQVDG